MSVTRWIFEDVATSETWMVPINPNQMSSPTSARAMTYAFGSRWGQDRMHAKDSGPSSPVEWTFQGVLLTQEHYDKLLEWAQRLSLVRITDHLGRTFEVVISKFEPIERLPTPNIPWRADYTMTCLLLKEVTA